MEWRIVVDVEVEVEGALAHGARKQTRTILLNSTLVVSSYPFLVGLSCEVGYAAG
ncbi:MAG: hypothetical protein ACETVQ_01940 [Candidatus Bathyarchaeia archaeon]